VAGDAAPRMMLHACRLAFPHPLTGVPCAFESPVPF
jgi:23S rRNA-/tRNA-specific pseudouridylate synthase